MDMVLIYINQMHLVFIKKWVGMIILILVLNASSQYSTGVVLMVSHMGLRDVSSLMVALNTYINDECPSCVVNISGYASEQGVESSNNRLIKSRGEYITNILKGGLFKKLTDSDKIKGLKLLMVVL
jgi:hypothetical protein